MDSDMETKKKNNRHFSLPSLGVRNWVTLAGFVILFMIVLRMTLFAGKIPNIFKNEEGTVTTISKSSLQEMFEVSDLSTLEYVYNSIATVGDEDGVEKYYVAYEGTVILGIDFEQLEVIEDETEKKFIIQLPEIEVQDVNVAFDTMEYIFNKEVYETETVSQEAYKACLRDLEEKAGRTESLHKAALENTKDAVNALLEPFKVQMDEDTKFEIRMP